MAALEFIVILGCALLVSGALATGTGWPHPSCN